jgi:hypothetical protein
MVDIGVKRKARNFSVPQIQNMVCTDVFIRVLLRFLSVRLVLSEVAVSRTDACPVVKRSFYYWGFSLAAIQ